MTLTGLYDWWVLFSMTVSIHHNLDSCGANFPKVTSEYRMWLNKMEILIKFTVVNLKEK